jgi:antitoxin (DNA-binding transcriptional repressor) of toxin-antitoxin stability system
MKRKAKKQPARSFRHDENPPMESSSLQETPLSMLELRQNAAGIMEGLQSGVNYRLTYRGKTVGKIVPAQSLRDEISPDDAIFHMEDYISAGPKGHLTNEEIDRAVYGL